MKLRPPRIALDGLGQRHWHMGTQDQTLPTHLAQRRSHKDFKGNQRRHRKARQGKHRFVVHSGKRQWFAWFEIDPPKVHFASAFEDRLDQVELAHRYPTRRDDGITGGQALLDFVGELVLAVTANTQEHRLCPSALHRSHEGIAVTIADLARTRLSVRFNNFITGGEHGHAKTKMSDERRVSQARQQTDFLWSKT